MDYGRFFAKYSPHLQRWLYCWEHLKYVWNIYCVVTNHMRDLHTTETTGHERFPRGHGTNYFRFVLTFSFFYKQTITFPSHLFYSMCYNSEEYRFERFWNNLQSRCAGRDAYASSKLLYNDRNRSLKNKTETFLKFSSVLRVIDRSDRNPPITAR